MKADKVSEMGRPKKSEPTEPIRLPMSAVEKMRQLAIRAKMDPGDWFIQEFGELLNKKHLKMLQDQLQEAKDKK